MKLLGLEWVEQVLNQAPEGREEPLAGVERHHRLLSHPLQWVSVKSTLPLALGKVGPISTPTALPSKGIFWTDRWSRWESDLLSTDKCVCVQ